jgi:hypothetical protein
LFDFLYIKEKSNVKNLLFFNKEGYPHNFQYNKDTESWEGKIIFDENSDQTFKTQSLHIFESVDPIEFTIDADLIHSDYNNNSGLTIIGETNFKNQLITNIQKVNESNEFYSKWIYGYDFNKKFPVGTIISFSGIIGIGIGSSDFTDDKFFTVLTVKKNAILIITDTSNDLFNFVYTPSGYISSINSISINDYNRNLLNNNFFNNLHENKKISILNSNYNDSIVTIKKTGITYSYLNELKLNGDLNNDFTLKLQFFTERPKLLDCDVTPLYINNINYLTFSKNCTILEPEKIYTSTGIGETKKDIIFEDINGNKLFNGITFTVDSLVTEKFIEKYKLTFKKYYYQENNNIKWNNEWNTIQFEGYNSNIQIGDTIKLIGISNPLLTSSTFLMNNREFSISNIIYNSNTNISILFTRGYIIDEDNSEYEIYQILKPHQVRTVSITPSGDISLFTGNTYSNSICYLTSNILNMSQNYVSGSTNVNSDTIDAFITKYKSTLNMYGIDVFKNYRNNDNYLSIESLYGSKFKYFSVSGFTNGVKITDDFSLTNNGITEKINIITNEKLTSEKSNIVSENLYKNTVNSEIILNINSDTDRFGFKLGLNGIEYFTYFYINTQSTINKFIDIFDEILTNKGFIINSGYNMTYSGYTLNISTDVDIWDLNITVNILSSYQIIKHERNRAIYFSANEIITNSNLYDLGLATGMILKINGSTYSENNKEYNIISLTNNTISLSYQGTFMSEPNVSLICETREFIRKPRGKYNRDVYFNVYWDIPNEELIDESIFLYDISGEQLVPFNNNDAYKYIGQTPLINSLTENVVFLNDEPNRDLNKINNPKYQQTVFDKVTHKLEQLDSLVSYNYIPEPMEIFIGYNAPQEGVNNRILKINKIETLENTTEYFSYSGYTNSESTGAIPNFTFDNQTCEFKAPIDFNFISYGFEKDQLVKFYFIDQSKTNQKIFENIYTYKIKDVARQKLIIDSSYIGKYDSFDTYNTGYTFASSGFTYFNTTGTTFYFKIEVQPKEILSCSIFGQTEIEDIRYKVNLNNVGVQLEDDVYKILYDSDINDDAIDYTLFNRKRKEMLTSYREIYDYISSYKSLINAINFFGYNDLKLYEYYRNIDQSSYLYSKLHKVLIPDIFDNSVEGWTELDFISGKYQNQNTWKKTNLFNLNYQITDENGDNVLIYSLEEVQYKLTKLKTWLRQNIIPISANLLDITGVATTNQTLYQDYDESNQTQKSVVERKSTVVNFNYTATLNFGSDYLITVNFYTLSGKTGTTIDNNEKPLSFSAKIRTFYLSGSTIDNPTDILVPVQYLKINKNDLKPFSFNLNKYVDPYILIETTTYDNDGSGLGYVNNKVFYFDEPRNHWLVNHNFDLSQMKYYQTTDYTNNNKQSYLNNSTIIDTSVETNVKLNTLNNTHI